MKKEYTRTNHFKKMIDKIRAMEEHSLKPREKKHAKLKEWEINQLMDGFDKFNENKKTPQMYKDCSVASEHDEIWKKIQQIQKENKIFEKK